ncbi:SGNH/GDSL hydrolase family protein [Nocardioides sp. DS6]|uniref:SGNH/GDSL hydrolase family protein n=1 Tax=Nocardioides eburneus TaxID=3231482 RepID=A0ABV3T675_9ACTN
MDRGTYDGRRVAARAAPVGVLLLVVALLGGLLAGCGESPEERAARIHGMCALYRHLADDRARMVTGSGKRVVVIGDSWSVGRNLPDPAQSWPAALPGEIHVAGFSGSGFSEQDMSKCGEVSFADRASAAVSGGANLVVVEGGLNDVIRTNASIRAGFDKLMTILSPYDVVVIGPTITPRHGTKAVRVDRLLHRLCNRVGVPYVSTLDIDLRYMPDGLHPTASGHRRFGTLVAERIARTVPTRPAVSP